MVAQRRARKPKVHWEPGAPKVVAARGLGRMLIALKAAVRADGHPRELKFDGQLLCRVEASS